jgi:hypothetical protein
MPILPKLSKNYWLELNRRPAQNVGKLNQAEAKVEDS